MTIDQITQAAVALGIKLTHANEGTEMYKSWAARVRKAHTYDLDAKFAAEYWPGSHQLGLAEDSRAKAIAEANRYAI
jgi:hypothetical protein